MGGRKIVAVPALRRRSVTPWAALLTAITLVALALSAGWGCTPEPQVPVRVGSHIWPGFEPLYLARAEGYYPPHSVRLVEYTTGSDGLRAFQVGAIDAMALTLDEALLLAESTPDMAVVLVLDTSVGGDVVLARPPLSSLRALKGKRVGLETTALGAYVLARALQSVGMSPADVQVVPLETLEQERAFREGSVDAVVTYEPFRTKLMALGARQVFDSSQIPGEIVDVIVVRRSFADKHSEQVAVLVEGWFKALDLIRRDRQRTVALMAKRERLSADEFERALTLLRHYNLEQNRDMLTGPAPALIPTAQRLGELMLANRLLERAPDLSHFIDGRFVKEAGP